MFLFILFELISQTNEPICHLKMLNRTIILRKEKTLSLIHTNSSCVKVLLSKNSTNEKISIQDNFAIHIVK